MKAFKSSSVEHWVSDKTRISKGNEVALSLPACLLVGRCKIQMIRIAKCFLLEDFAQRGKARPLHLTFWQRLLEAKTVLSALLRVLNTRGYMRRGASRISASRALRSVRSIFYSIIRCGQRWSLPRLVTKEKSRASDSPFAHHRMPGLRSVGLCVLVGPWRDLHLAIFRGSLLCTWGERKWEQGQVLCWGKGPHLLNTNPYSATWWSQENRFSPPQLTHLENEGLGSNA